jgi:hypothetical protein
VLAIVTSCSGLSPRVVRELSILRTTSIPWKRKEEVHIYGILLHYLSLSVMCRLMKHVLDNYSFEFWCLKARQELFNCFPSIFTFGPTKRKVGKE